MNPERWQRLKELFNASLDLSEGERAAFLADERNGDDRLRRKVARLLKAHEQACDFIAEPAFVEAGIVDEEQEASFVGRQIGPYEVLKELGRGGMGAVYLAVRSDDEYRKEVAIKLIKRGMDTDAILKRFRAERQILANLEHANIARLLDGGTTEDGLPYFVMEYVKGEPITKYCDRNRLNTTERLKLFRQVCSAVQHSHQNLVVHRDIKPSNIIVTEDGTPKLLDFGIAKLLSADWSNDATEQTASMMRLMTPEYASPEQLRGLAITTATDVYSLGVVLYELLSGHRPFKNKSCSQEEVIQAILTEKPVKPSAGITQQYYPPQTDDTGPARTLPDVVGHTREGNIKKLRRHLVGDLDNIILKALRKEPMRRYLSVQEFSEDIRRHLEGLPVTARRDTFRYRAGKFVARHKLGVAAAAIVLFTLLSATAITTWQARVARRERDKAERRFNALRQFSNSMLTEVNGSLAAIPGTSPAQRLIAQKSLTYLDLLAQDETKDPDLLGELATAYITVGDYQSWTLADNESALESYQKGIAACRKRLVLEPDNLSAKRDLDFGLFKLSEALAFLGKTQQLLQTCDEIISLRQEILASEPTNRESYNLAGSFEYRGEFLMSLSRTEEAKADFLSAVSLITRAINQQSETMPDARVELSTFHIARGSLFANLNEWQKAAEDYRRASEIADAVYRENPSLIQAFRNSSSSHNRLGDALAQMGDHQGALENYRYSLRIITEALSQNRNDSQLIYGEVKYNIKVGEALEKVGQRRQALEMIQRGRDLCLSMLARDKGRSSTITYSVELLQKVADFFASIKKRESAIAALDDIREPLEELASKSPQDINLAQQLAGIYTKLGDIYAEADARTKVIKSHDKTNLREAQRWYVKSFNIWKDLQERKLDSTSKNKLDELSQKIAGCDKTLKK